MCGARDHKRRDCPQKHSLPQRYVVCITRTEQRHLCQKPKLSMIQHVVATWMGDRYMLGFAPTLTFLHSQILCTLQMFLGEIINIKQSPLCVCVCVCVYIICMQKGHMHTLKSLWTMSEFSGLWKHQNNPECTDGVEKIYRPSMHYDV